MRIYTHALKHSSFPFTSSWLPHIFITASTQKNIYHVSCFLKKHVIKMYMYFFCGSCGQSFQNSWWEAKLSITILRTCIFDQMWVLGSIVQVPVCKNIEEIFFTFINVQFFMHSLTKCFYLIHRSQCTKITFFMYHAIWIFFING